MEFILCTCRPSTDQFNYLLLYDRKNEKDATSVAHKAARQAEKGWLVGLFTRDGAPLNGWKVLEGGKLKPQRLDALQLACRVDQGTYESVRCFGSKLKQ